MGAVRATARASKIAGLAIAALSAALSITSHANAADTQTAALTTTFQARDATRYPENPTLAPYGLKDITVVYENSLWPAGASHAEPDLNYIANTYIPKIRNKGLDAIAIDIEAWLFKPTLTVEQWNANIEKFKKVISVFRREMPTTKLGLYLMMPERNWLAPCGDPKKRLSRTTSWHQRNLRLQPLADAVDIIFPSLYTFYDDAASVACWPTYAKANIAEAKIFGKPVWAFLWMKYHTDQTKWVPAPFWRTQLETVYANADGFAIWSRAAAGDAWSWTAPWWVETAKFLKEKGLAQ
jgi:hypothetical protein